MLPSPTTRSASILPTELGIPWEETHMRKKIRLSNALFLEKGRLCRICCIKCGAWNYLYILLTVANDFSFPAQESMRLYLTMCSSDRCELGVYMQTLKTEFPVCPFFDQQCWTCWTNSWFDIPWCKNFAWQIHMPLLWYVRFLHRNLCNNLWTSNKVIIEIWKDAPFLLDTLCLHKFWDMKNGHFPITMCPPCPPFHLRIGKISVVTAPKSNSDVDRKGWTDTSWGWMNLGKGGIGVTPIMWLLGGVEHRNMALCIQWLDVFSNDRWFGGCTIAKKSSQIISPSLLFRTQSNCASTLLRVHEKLGFIVNKLGIVISRHNWITDLSKKTSKQAHSSWPPEPQNGVVQQNQGCDN